MVGDGWPVVPVRYAHRPDVGKAVLTCGDVRFRPGCGLRISWRRPADRRGVTARKDAGPRRPSRTQPPSPHGGPPGAGSGRGPGVIAVACGLLLLVLARSLAAFFGVRAWMGDDGPREEQTSTPQGSALIEGHRGAGPER